MEKVNMDLASELQKAVKRSPVFLPAREGDHILVIIPNYWGRSTTFTRAAAEVNRQSGVKVTVRTKEMHVYSVHPQTYCEGVAGGIVSRKGHPPIQLK